MKLVASYSGFLVVADNDSDTLVPGLKKSVSNLGKVHNE